MCICAAPSALAVLTIRSFNYSVRLVRVISDCAVQFIRSPVSADSTTNAMPRTAAVGVSSAPCILLLSLRCTDALDVLTTRSFKYTIFLMCSKHTPSVDPYLLRDAVISPLASTMAQKVVASKVIGSQPYTIIGSLSHGRTCISC